mmetsp:Transcript_14893/g.20126  ORF Transcript_14893/g.20126 Transcript_14893/m.20126 type:complete len:362 (-) Transcript_14893:966-2051(-)
MGMMSATRRATRPTTAVRSTSPSLAYRAKCGHTSGRGRMRRSTSTSRMPGLAGTTAAAILTERRQHGATPSIWRRAGSCATSGRRPQRATSRLLLPTVSRWAQCSRSRSTIWSPARSRNTTSPSMRRCSLPRWTSSRSWSCPRRATQTSISRSIPRGRRAPTTHSLLIPLVSTSSPSAGTTTFSAARLLPVAFVTYTLACLVTTRIRPSTSLFTPSTRTESAWAGARCQVRRRFSVRVAASGAALAMAPATRSAMSRRVSSTAATASMAPPAAAPTASPSGLATITATRRASTRPVLGMATTACKATRAVPPAASRRGLTIESAMHNATTRRVAGMAMIAVMVTTPATTTRGAPIIVGLSQ